MHANDNLNDSDAALVWVAASSPTGLDRVELYHGDQLLADLDYRACPTCDIAVLERIRVAAPEHRRQGLGTRLVVAVLAAHPDYSWTTTALADTAREFWDAIRWPGRRGDPHRCPHMHHADQRNP